MASTAPQNPALPLLYKELVPISQQEHGSWRYKMADSAKFLSTEHAVPVTVEEFSIVQRFYPIIFSSGDQPVPLALMGLNEGVNTFIDDDGKMIGEVYVPAYVRRYPFLLAKLTPETQELSLCFDPTCDMVGDFSEGDPLFADDKPTDSTQNALNFCESFEQAGQRTGAFIEELQKHELLMEGEVAIQQDGVEAPFIYRGFQMVNQDKLKELRGDVLRGWNQSGLLPLIHAHLFSLDLMRDIFGRQQALGKGPAIPAAQTAPAAVK